jgi:hypothetical protein
MDEPLARRLARTRLFVLAASMAYTGLELLAQREKGVCTVEIFQPNLQLSVEPDGEYTLDAVTITPNSGYSAGRARPGAPPNVRLTPETFPVLLEIRERRGRVLQVLTPVRHHLRNLKLGPNAGKTSVLAFAMLGDRVVGSASIPVGPGHECRKHPVTVDSHDWYAWIDRMPPGPPSFHVTGVVVLPTPGFEVRLVAASPQGINPTDLILDLKVTPLPGIWPQLVTSMSVRYDQSPAGVAYHSVLIREPDGDTIQIPVEEVQ